MSAVVLSIVVGLDVVGSGEGTFGHQMTELAADVTAGAFAASASTS